MWHDLFNSNSDKSIINVPGEKNKNKTFKPPGVLASEGKHLLMQKKENLLKTTLVHFA